MILLIDRIKLHLGHAQEIVIGNLEIDICYFYQLIISFYGSLLSILNEMIVSEGDIFLLLGFQGVF